MNSKPSRNFGLPWLALCAGAAASCVWFCSPFGSDGPAPAPVPDRAPQSETSVPARPPVVDLDEVDFTAYENGGAITGRIESTGTPAEYEVEWSPSEDFADQSKSLRRSHPEFTTDPVPPGTYFVRARVRAASGTPPTEWSNVREAKVTRHTRPTTPQVYGVPPRAFVGQTLPINSESKTVAIRVKISDDQGRTVYVSRSKEDVFTPPAPGRYTVSAVAVNKDGFESQPSPAVTFEAADIPRAVAEPNPNRDETGRALLERAAAPVKPNEKFRGDVVTIEGLLWRMQSSQQYYQAAERPTSVGVGIRGLHWFGTRGIEGILRTDLFAANESGKDSQIMDLELHYHRRWFMTSPFTTAREMQMTIYGGVERFRNARSLLYSNGYDLFKVGVTAHVPFSSLWSISGEGGVGFDMHGSRKFELQGLLTYYYSREWSLGLGYRSNFFEARTASQAPGGFYPYREGYTEFRSVLNYQF